MIIDYAIVSTNDNPTYKDFWEVVKPVWINHIKIKPILVNIGDYDEVIDNHDHIIYNIKKIEGIDTGFQSQVSRMWVTKFFEEKVCLISDIDMLPMSEKYFKENVIDVDDNSMVIYSADAYNPYIDRYPMCYISAKGKTFDEILQLSRYNNFENFCRSLIKRGQGWNTDELFFGEYVNKFKDQNRIVKLNRGWSNGRADWRIDRIYWEYNTEEIDNYIDSHLLRPYSNYKEIIDKLIEDLIE